jgi:high-affinity iron transporter
MEGYNVSTTVGTNLDCDPLYPFQVQTTATTTTTSMLLTFVFSPSVGACVDGMSTCSFGCYDSQRQGCYSGISQQQCTSAVGSNFSWESKCGCQCRQRVCNMGCWDYEDESCLKGIDQNGCAEIYAHVAWLRKCNCREVIGNSSSLGNDGDFTDGTASATSIYFSVPAFVVLFRESLEVMILLVIMIQFLHKAKEDGTIDDATFRRFRFHVYAGSGLGFLFCLTLGICLLALASLAYGLFQGNTQTIFEGVMTLLTSFVLTLLAINFYKMIFNRFKMEKKMQQQVLQTVETARKVDAADQSFSQRYAFFILALTTGTREGLESIIFLIGVVSDMQDLSALPLPIISALVLARVLGCCFFQGTKKLRLDWFMKGSALVLLLIAAGAFTSALHAFQELGAFGTWTPKSQRGWQNRQVWDLSECCSDKTNRFFVLMNALVGWQHQPTPVGFFSYAFYWIVVLVIGFFVVRHISRQQKRRQEQLCKESATDTTNEENALTDQAEAEAVVEDVAKKQALQDEGDAQSIAV